MVVNGSTDGQTMLGVIVSATGQGTNDSTSTGTFDVKMNGQVHDLKDEKICEDHVIAHRYLVHKTGVSFKWIAPKSPPTPCIEFRATVIEHSDVWYKDEGGLTQVICEELTQRDEADAVTADSPDRKLEEDECCACGHAMYSVTFQGLWSRQTHPKQFPDAKNAYLLHWSNVVGSTHSNDYRIWDLDQYASRAVKEVCEFGSSRSLENEMKDNSEKIRTVIKTNSLWGPENILSSVKAGFTVNKKKHLLSLLTMIGPSPDWCLGVSALSMCTPNCTWADNMEIDLFPWDAGTDSGITYMARNEPAEPLEKIHRLTSAYPSNRDSPFYGQPLKPFARLVITKNKEACTTHSGETDSAENSPSTEELVSQMKKKILIKKKMEMEKCATSLWADWDECSNTCGAGMKTRRRTLKNPGIVQSMCNVELMEKEPCVGGCQEPVQRKKISSDFVMRHDEERDPGDICAVTGWSDWSPCSQTCGLGMKERWRMFISRSEKTVDCGIHLMEKDLCRGKIFDCRKAMMMKNFTAICSLEADLGPCKGNFPRWFYNSSMDKCQVFSYGGCRGNENRFDTEEECVELCAEHMAEVRRGAMADKPQLLDKLALMDKQRQMELDAQMKQQQMQKQAMMDKQKQMEADKQQKEFMMHKQAMMAVGDGQDVHQIKATIMKLEMMIKSTESLDMEMRAKKLMLREQRRMVRRLRRKLRQMMRGGDDEGEEEEDDSDDDNQRSKSRRRRRQRKHHADGPEVDCMVSPWTEWSACSVTCGKGESTKTRMIKQEAENGGQKCPRLEKTRLCNIDSNCPVDCKLGEWGEWSPCSQTCGDNAVQLRRRPRLTKPKNGGLACPSKREKRFCSVPMCPDADMEKNINYFMMFHRRY